VLGSVEVDWARVGVHEYSASSKKDSSFEAMTELIWDSAAFRVEWKVSVEESLTGPPLWDALAGSDGDSVGIDS
jgi:hypothetical protein